MRLRHLQQDLCYSHYTKDLFTRYRKHLGTFRYSILLESQALVVPQSVKLLLGFRRVSLFRPLIAIYKLARLVKADMLIKALILPEEYKSQVKAIDRKQIAAKCPFNFKTG